MKSLLTRQNLFLGNKKEVLAGLVKADPTGFSLSTLDYPYLRICEDTGTK